MSKPKPLWPLTEEQRRTGRYGWRLNGPLPKLEPNLPPRPPPREEKWTAERLRDETFATLWLDDGEPLRLGHLDHLRDLVKRWTPLHVHQDDTHVYFAVDPAQPPAGPDGEPGYSRELAKAEVIRQAAIAAYRFSPDLGRTLYPDFEYLVAHLIPDDEHS